MCCAHAAPSCLWQRRRTASVRIDYLHLGTYLPCLKHHLHPSSFVNHHQQPPAGFHFTSLHPIATGCTTHTPRRLQPLPPVDTRPWGPPCDSAHQSHWPQRPSPTLHTALIRSRALSSHPTSALDAQALTGIARHSQRPAAGARPLIGPLAGRETLGGPLGPGGRAGCKVPPAFTSTRSPAPAIAPPSRRLRDLALMHAAMGGRPCPIRCPPDMAWQAMQVVGARRLHGRVRPASWSAAS